MVRVTGGDPAAFAELYDRHVSRALRTARWSCPSQAHAEDAVQEAFLAAWRNRAAYRPEAGSCRGWLMTIVRNCAIDQARRNPSHRQMALENQDAIAARPTGSLHDDLVARGEAAGLRASVDRLPVTQGEVIQLAYFRGLSHVEIAARLALPLGTVKGRIRLGLIKLRAETQTPDWAL